MNGSGLVIGVDTGGTFTDVVVIDAGGDTTAAKALSTPDRLDDGVIAGLRLVAATRGVTLEELLGSTRMLAHGTTVGLNALLTGRTARVGMLVTAGFSATLAIAKAGKLLDLPEEDLHVPARWRPPSSPVDRRDIAEIHERVDVTGRVVVPLDRDRARAAVIRLVDRGVEALAVALLWSPVNPEHERAVAAIAREVAPGMSVTLSSEAAGRVGEYERFVTAVVDAQIRGLVASNLAALESRLRRHGFSGRLLVTGMSGGVQPLERVVARPIETLRSGPAGGIGATRALGERLGKRNLIATDVGGTSFDVGLVIDREVQVHHRPGVNRLPLAIPAVDVTSIGTGGGSIAWYDGDLGSLRVGPRSAGASPGPACYGRGGTEPTVTDAAVVLGYLVTLEGRLTLDREAAARAIDSRIAGPLGMDVATAAEGVLEVACAQMRDLVRRTTILRGHDPSDFTLVAYGGAGPQYVGRVAADLGVREVIVPALAAQFSAFGAATADVRVAEHRDLAPVPLESAGPAVMAAVGELRAALLPTLEAPVSVRATVGLRYYRQIERMDVPLPDRIARGEHVRADRADGPGPAGWVASLASEFRSRYERIVGPNSAPAGTPIEVIAVSVELARSAAVTIAARRPSHACAPRGRRSVRFGGEPIRVDVWAWSELAAGQRVSGPCLVDSESTTVVVHPGQAISCDEFGHLHLTVAAS